MHFKSFQIFHFFLVRERLCVYSSLNICSVPFQAILGPKFGPIPNGKTPPFFPIDPEKFPIQNSKKSELESSFLIATKTNDYYIFTFVEVNTLSNCSLTSSDIKSNVF